MGKWKLGFYNRPMKLLLEKNPIEMYLIQNKGKSVVAERFIRALKNKIWILYIFKIKKCVYW